MPYGVSAVTPRQRGSRVRQMIPWVIHANGKWRESRSSCNDRILQIYSLSEKNVFISCLIESLVNPVQTTQKPIRSFTQLPHVSPSGGNGVWHRIRTISCTGVVYCFLSTVLVNNAGCFSSLTVCVSLFPSKKDVWLRIRETEAYGDGDERLKTVLYSLRSITERRKGSCCHPECNTDGYVFSFSNTNIKDDKRI